MFVVLVGLILYCTAYYEKPVIGIVTQPTSCIEKDIEQTYEHYSYIPTSYVDWIESGGGRVVPVLFDYPESKLETLYQSLNVFPGGWCPLDNLNDQFMKTQEYFYNRLISDHSKQDGSEPNFSVWGTCQGFESLAVITSQNTSILHRGIDAMEILMPLNVTDYGMNESRMFRNIPKDVLNILRTQLVTFNWHEWGVLYPSDNPVFSDFYEIVSYDVDKNGIHFVSSAEAKDYPIYAVQWHPEFLIYEDGIPRKYLTYDAVWANSYFALFYVQEIASQSNHSFESQDVENNFVIDNYEPLFTGKIYVTEKNRMRSAFFFEPYGGKDNPDDNDDDDDRDEDEAAIISLSASLAVITTFCLFFFFLNWVVCCCCCFFGVCTCGLFCQASTPPLKKKGKSLEDRSEYESILGQGDGQMKKKKEEKKNKKKDVKDENEALRNELRDYDEDEGFESGTVGYLSTDKLF